MILLVARGGFGLRSAAVGAEQAPPEPSALDTTDPCCRLVRGNASDNKKEPHLRCDSFSSERGIRTLDNTGMNRVL